MAGVAERLRRVSEADELRQAAGSPPPWNPYGLPMGNSPGDPDGGDDLFFYSISTSQGMKPAPGLTRSEVVQGENRDRVEAPGYFDRCELAPKSKQEVDGRTVPLVNPWGWIHVLVHWHGEEPPSKVRLNPKTGVVRVDQKGQTEFNLNRPRIAARFWANENIPGMQGNIKRLSGPWHLVESAAPPLQTASPRVPKDEEIKRPKRGRPKTALPPLPGQFTAGEVEAAPVPQATKSRRGGPPKALSPPLPDFLPDFGAQQQWQRGSAQGWIYDFDKRGNLTRGYCLPIEHILEQLERAKWHGEAVDSPAELLPRERRDEVLVNDVGERGATVEEIVFRWSAEEVTPHHHLFHQCQAHVRKALSLLKKNGLEHGQNRYAVSSRHEDITLRDPVTGKPRTRRIPRWRVELIP